MDNHANPTDSRTAAASLLISTVLRNAAELCERGWCQGQFALNASGEPVWQYGDEACAWCVIGAIDRAADGARFPVWGQSITKVCEVIGWEDASVWNDYPGRTADEVVAKLREAAALAESEGR